MAIRKVNNMTNIMTVFNALQLIGGIILAVGYFPQIRKIIRTKSANDFHLPTYLMLTLGIGLMEVYSVALIITSGAGHAFLVTNTLSLALVATMAVLIRKYRTKK
jgi:MtN3 and saliva related transmembrane protein